MNRNTERRIYSKYRDICLECFFFGIFWWIKLKHFGHDRWLPAFKKQCNSKFAMHFADSDFYHLFMRCIFDTHARSFGVLQLARQIQYKSIIIMCKSRCETWMSMKIRWNTGTKSARKYPNALDVWDSHFTCHSGQVGTQHRLVWILLAQVSLLRFHCASLQKACGICATTLTLKLTQHQTYHLTLINWIFRPI